MEKTLKTREIHIISKFGKELVFDVNTLNLFSINRLTRRILEEANGKTSDDLVRLLSSQFDPGDISKVLKQLMALRLVGYDITGPESLSPSPPESDRLYVGIKSISLFVTQNCNLRCRYCLTRRTGHIVNKNMSLDVAQSSIDLLLRESNDLDEVIVGFYGGEPMLRFDLIRRIIDYARPRAERAGKKIIFSATTNGTSLTDDMVDYLADHQVSLLWSIDGDRDKHDTNRIFPDGSGSFDRLMPAFTRWKDKADHVAVLAVIHQLVPGLKRIADSLLGLGIHQIKIPPAVGPDGLLDMVDADIDRYNEEFIDMIRHFLENRLYMGTYPPYDFSTTHKRLEQKKRNPTSCSAGFRRFSVDPEGNILPCDNFIGESDFYMGNVLTGFDKTYQELFRAMRADNNPTCRSCWSRNLCGGWCPYYSLLRHKKLDQPVETHCKLFLNYFEVALAAYSEIKAQYQQGAGRQKEERNHDN